MNLTIVEAIKQKFILCFKYEDSSIYKICPWIYGVYIDDFENKESLLGLVIEKNGKNYFDVYRFYLDKISDIFITGGEFIFPSSKRMSQWKKIFIEI